MKTYQNYFLVFLTSIFLPSALLAKQESYTYHSDTGGVSSNTTWIVEPRENYVEIKGTSDDGTTLMECCSEDYTFDKYTYKSTKEPIEYEFVRDGNILYVNANIKGEKKSLHHILKRNPWIQQLGFGLKGFAKSKAKNYYFCILSQKDFSLHDMAAKKEGVFPLKIGDKEYKAKKINLSLTGFKSLFWSAEIWFDTKTGDCLLYKGDEGPNTALTVTTLSSKKLLKTTDKKASPAKSKN